MLYVHLSGILFWYFCIRRLIIEKEHGALWIQSLKKTVVQTQLVSMIYLIYSTSWHGGGAGAVLVKCGSIIKQKKLNTFSMHWYYRFLRIFLATFSLNRETTHFGNRILGFILLRQLFTWIYLENMNHNL